MLTESELEQLEAICRKVPLTSNTYIADDFITALFDTVLDYQNSVTTLRKAGDHFRADRWDEVRTLDDLERVMARFPEDREGDTELALYLWGNRHWRRARRAPRPLRRTSANATSRTSRR